MRALLLALVLVAGLLAGCSGNSGTTTTGTTSSAPGSVVHRNGAFLADAAWSGVLPAFSERYVASRPAGEPTLAIDRDGVAIFPTIAFDVAGGQLASTKVYRSEDQGLTWADATPSIGNLGLVPAAPTSLDPYVYADPVTGRMFSVDLYLGCSNLSFTDDGARTWTTNPIACGVPVNDHQTLFSGPSTTLPTLPVYPRVLYYCNNQIADAACSHSLDGGLSWQPGSPVYPGAEPGTEGGARGVCGSLHGHGHASEATGTVFIPKGHCGVAYVSRSEDNGLTWQRVIVDNSVGFDGHEAIVSTDKAGTVYYFFLDGDTLPRLSVSHDDGRTWGPPLNVTYPGVTTAKFPSIVAGDKGRIAFLYVGSTTPSGRHVDDVEECQQDPVTGDPPCPLAHPDELRNATWDAYVGFSLDADGDEPTFATVNANPAGDPLKRGACTDRCQGMFDFLDIEVHPTTGQVWTALVDLCNDACATPQGTSEDPITSRGAVGVQIAGPLLGSRLQD